jgi:hypothetical protein
MQADRPGTRGGSMGSEAPARYSGVWDCLRTTVRADGWAALLDGLAPRVAKIGLGQAVIFATYARFQTLFADLFSPASA